MPQSNTLAAEVEATHPHIAAKLRATDELHGRLHPDAGGHRPLTAAERKAQAAAALTLEEAQTVQEIEYGRWVANQPIHAGVALAFDTGHPVPCSHVARFGWDALGMVDRVEPVAPADEVDEDGEDGDPDGDPAGAPDDAAPAGDVDTDTTKEV